MLSLFSLSNIQEHTGSFHQRLKTWYKDVFRPLPWRATTDPYKIWLSEVILQQTRIDQGTDYYHNFIEHYPTVNDLAQAQEDEVLKQWQGLGYYSRARNLLKTAIRIHKEFGGVFPKEYKTVLSLPGIGPYTAAAILSFAYNLPFATVDGNVSRVISRLFAYEEPIDSTEGKKEINRIASELLDRENPRIHNNAMMELGATVCTPDNPDCKACPVCELCRGKYMEIASELPKKQPKKKVRTRYFNYVEITDPDNGLTLLERREGKDIWKGLYQPLLIETQTEKDPETFIEELSTINSIQEIGELRINSFTDTETHILSHQKIFARLYRATAKLNKENSFINGRYSTYTEQEVERLAFPKLLVNLFQKPNSLF